MISSRLLIDSHILIWLLYEPDKLSLQAKNLIEEAEAVYVSTVSLWELTLKFNIQKLAYSPHELIMGAEELNLNRMLLRDEHVLSTLDIKLPHKDPFDTLLIAQNEVEDCLFLTADNQILNSSYHTFKC
jgi:PIN domain nuclease of toxin-antitoxin system